MAKLRNIFKDIPLFIRKRDGKGFDLEDALFEISKCGGLVLYDQVTGGCVTLTVQNGVLVVDADPSSSETYGTATYIIPNPAFQSTAVLTATDNPNEGDTVTVGATTYTFTTTVDAANEVLIGATASDTLDNLIAAVNAGAGAGTLYGAGTVANASATAAAGVGDTVDFTSIAYGAATDAIASTTTGSGDATFADVTFVYAGTDDILVNSVALPTTFEITSPGVSAQIASLAPEIRDGLIAAGFTPIAVTAAVSGLTFVVNVTLNCAQLATLLAIDIETDSSGPLVPTNNC